MGPFHSRAVLRYPHWNGAPTRSEPRVEREEQHPREELDAPRCIHSHLGYRHLELQRRDCGLRIQRNTLVDVGGARDGG